MQGTEFISTKRIIDLADATLTLASPIKAAKDEAIKAGSYLKHDDSHKKKAFERKNNNKASSSMALVDTLNESDDDDSVFINENKPKKASKTLIKHKNDASLNVEPVWSNVPSAALSVSNVSSLQIKSVVPVGAQNHVSRYMNFKSETVVR